MGTKIKEMVPSYGVSLKDNPELIHDIQTRTARMLGLVDESQENPV